MIDNPVWNYKAPQRRAVLLNHIKSKLQSTFQGLTSEAFQWKHTDCEMLFMRGFGGGMVNLTAQEGWASAAVVLSSFAGIFPVSTLRWRHNERDRCLKSPASRVFTQAFIQAQIKGNIKPPRHWPLCREFTGDRPVTRKMFPFHDVIMKTRKMVQWVYGAAKGI